MEMTTTLQKVKTCLETKPLTRNDDRLLTFSVWKLCGYDIAIQDGKIIFNCSLQDFFKLPRPESICRARRIVQNELNLFPPTDEEVKRKRGIKENDMTQYFANKEYIG